jgi:Mn-containing catalase
VVALALPVEISIGEGVYMFLHKKEPVHEVRITEPSPWFAQQLLEQFGGATGELTAGLQYFVQSLHTDDAGIRDMLLDIATEEFGHLELVGLLIEQHTKGAKQAQQDRAFTSTLFKIRGVGPHFLDSQGTAWSARYINEGGNVVRDLRADIAAEGGALQTYIELLDIAPDDGSRRALHHLATREVSHTKMFMTALKSINKLDDPLFGEFKPDDTVDLYFNMSSDGTANERGPWNSEPAFKYIEDPLQWEKQHNKKS